MVRMTLSHTGTPGNEILNLNKKKKFKNSSLVVTVIRQAAFLAEMDADSLKKAQTE